METLNHEDNPFGDNTANDSIDLTSESPSSREFNGYEEKPYDT